MQLDSGNFDLYPDDGVIPGIDNCIFQDHETDVSDTFAPETAGFSEHPAQIVHECDECSTPMLLLERKGVSDPESVKLSSRAFIASALKNLVTNVPDLIIHRSSAAIPKYNNPDLLPGMFPTLFPLGIGGFDNARRLTNLSFPMQVNALLDVPDKSFRRHDSYIFVVLNIMQRRAAHLHTHFTVRKLQFDSITKSLTSVSSDVLQSLVNHLQHEGKIGTLNAEEQHAMNLLNHVNTISAHIPGSQASKIFTRNKIRSYFSEFGLPHIYFTLNPRVTHNPIFQVMVGDLSVDLTQRFPFLAPGRE
jgi:hypothetical protein